MKSYLGPVCAMLVVVLARETWAESVAFAQEPDAKPKAETAKAESEGSKPLSLADYDVLITRNIFSHEQPRARNERRRRDRDRERESGEYAEDFVGPPRPKDYIAPAALKAEADIVLIGAVQRDGVGTATLEDRRAGKVLLVKAGDKVASGVVGKITVDGLEYIVGDKTQAVPIGSNLEGGTSTAKPVENGATSPAAEGTDGSGSGGNMGSILEQMKRKRLKELGQ